jgi:hypothetical protein
MAATGTHHLEWDGKGPAGDAVASGIYFVRLEVGSTSRSRKLILVR